MEDENGPFTNIEPFVITSSKKLGVHWIWTRDTYDKAWGLASWVRHKLDEAGDVQVTVSVLNVASGTVERR